jgi:N-acetylneuraminate synthase
VPANSYDDTYGAHREFLEFDVDQHRELMEYCNTTGLGYSTSVWDTTSANEIVSLKPDLIKAGSPSNQHFEMVKVLCDEYEGDLHVRVHGPTGMTTKPQRKRSKVRALSCLIRFTSASASCTALISFSRSCS